MRPQLVLGTVAIALALPLVGFVVTTAGAAEQPLPGTVESATQTNSSAQIPTSAPAGDAASRPLPSTTPSPRTTPSETPRPETSPSEVSKVMPSARETTRPVDRPSSPPSQVARQADSPARGWKAPKLVVGANDIAAPVMASGRTASALVACAPSSACAVSGNTLVISDAATSVSVTWSVPGSRAYRAWSAQASL
jgi:hypothetical protein